LAHSAAALLAAVPRATVFRHHLRAARNELVERWSDDLFDAHAMCDKFL
jgi:hypothetical protein